MTIPAGVVIWDGYTEGIATVADTAYVEGSLVKKSADHIVTPCTTAGEAAYGICTEDLAAADNTQGRSINVLRLGKVRLQAGAAITRHAPLTVLGTGSYKFRPKVSATTADRIFGIADTAQATVGSTFEASVDFLAGVIRY